MKLFTLLAGVATVAATLTGCAAQPAAPANTETPAVTEISGDTALLNFVDLATRSCDQARNEGVVEKSNTDVTNVLVAEKDAVDGFSAISIDESGAKPSVNLIYESDIFESCYYSSLFSLASDGGQGITDLGITVKSRGTGISDTGTTYTVTQNSDGIVSETVYTVADGLIGTASTTVEGTDVVVNVTYGNYGDYLDELKAAVPPASE